MSTSPCKSAWQRFWRFSATVIVLCQLFALSFAQPPQARADDDDRHDVILPSIHGDRDARNFLDEKLGRARTLKDIGDAHELIDQLEKKLKNGELDAATLEALLDKAKE